MGLSLISFNGNPLSVLCLKGIARSPRLDRGFRYILPVLCAPKGEIWRAKTGATHRGI